MQSNRGYIHIKYRIELLSKLYFCHWKTPGVPERMCSVNFDAWIWGEYQTLGGPALKVTGISDDYYRWTMGVIVIGLGTPRSAGEKFGCIWKLLGAPVRSLEVPMTDLGAPGQGLGAPRITIAQSGKHNIFFDKMASANRNHSYYRSFNQFKTRVFSFYTHLSIHVSQ
jgi:hypothetical protein